MEVHSVFLDIDGTLITDTAGPFDDDIAGIKRARQKGTKFFLCTGRSLFQIRIILGETPWVDGIVAAGGAHVILGKETLYHHWMPVPVLCEIANLFLAKGKKCCFRGDENNYAVNQNGNKIPITSANDFALKYSGARVSMLTVDLSMGEEERACLEKYFDIYPQIPHFDCFIKGGGKAKGAKLILERLGLDRKYCVAIGDSANDLDVFELAGTGIAVGNACDSLKEKASWISANVGEGAVVNALEYLGLT